MQFGFRLVWREATNLSQPRRTNCLLGSISQWLITISPTRELWIGLLGHFLDPLFLICRSAALGVFGKKRSTQEKAPYRRRREEFSMHYITVDQIISMVSFSKYGPGALMAKLGVEVAYRNATVLPSNYHLLGMKWRGQYFADSALPFVLGSASFICYSVADMVEWNLLHKHSLSELEHYLDNFITAGPTPSPQCLHSLQRLCKCVKLWACFSIPTSESAHLLAWS